MRIHVASLMIRQVEAVCTEVLTTASMPSSDASRERMSDHAMSPSESLMRALPPLRVVPEAAKEAVGAAESKILVPTATASSSSSSSAGESKDQDTNTLTHSFVRRTCPSCHQSYHADAQLLPEAVPRLLQCAHTLCTTCAQRDLDQARSTGATLIRCCVCTQPTMLSELSEGGVLPEATAIVGLVRQPDSSISTRGASICLECSEEEATLHCKECSDEIPLCRECFVALHPARSKAKKDHSPLPLAVVSVTASRCEAHNKPLTQFCSWTCCLTLLCEICVADHKASLGGEKHVIEALETAAANYRQKVEPFLATIAPSAISSFAQLQIDWYNQSSSTQRQMSMLVRELQSKSEVSPERRMLFRLASDFA
jgi:hypothetical protein